MYLIKNIFRLFCLFSVVHTIYIIDKDDISRTFEGIGAISGGGATSKLLINYPVKERNEILDFLFKPNFGASLQILKVEIGGDSQSTDGTESSHMHEPWDENYNRGYEWWLMKQAKKRNPSIKLYGLPWAFPGWLGKTPDTDELDPYANPELTADYVMRWVRGAATVHGLRIDYIGIWNERKYNSTYIKILRRVLNENGFAATKIVASDGNWQIAEETLVDTTLADSYDIIGVHYPGTTTTPAALQTNKTLWSSEDYSTYNDDVGAGCLARILNQNYVNGKMTSTIMWNLIASYYRHLPFGDDGLMTAREPWSGHYTVNAPIWITAHTTQFVDIGWSYLSNDGSCDGHLAGGGSYVILVSETGGAITIVIETMSRKHSQCIRPYLPNYDVETTQTAIFKLLPHTLPGLSTLYLWKSELKFDGSSSQLFEQLLPVKLTTEREIHLSLDVDCVYTLTSRSEVGRKGSTVGDVPVSSSFPLPYLDIFDSYDVNSEAYMFAPQVGVFEVTVGGDDPKDKVNSQVLLTRPIDWCANVVPITIGGDYAWSDVTVSLLAMIPSVNGTESVFLAARITKGGCDSDKSAGVYLHVRPMQGRYLLSKDPLGHQAILMGNMNNKLTADTWFSIVLRLRKGKVSISIDLYDLVIDQSLPSDVSTNGFVGYGTANLSRASFDYFFIT